MRLCSSSLLRLPAFSVCNFDGLHEQVAEMFEVMHASGGVGLAAPQVGIARQIAVIDVGEPLVLVNPRIVVRKGKRVVREGCLSLPGKHFNVRRHRFVVVQYLDVDGLNQSIAASDSLLAQVLEHEIDHLAGKMIDHRR